MRNMNLLAELIDQAGQGARDDSAIDEQDLAILKQVAQILREENCNSVDNLKERLAHYCE